MANEEYTIQEYSRRTGEYTTIGYSSAPTAKEAKLRFIEQNNWTPRKGIVLFVKTPICR